MSSACVPEGVVQGPLYANQSQCMQYEFCQAQASAGCYSIFGSLNGFNTWVQRYWFLIGPSMAAISGLFILYNLYWINSYFRDINNADDNPDTQKLIHREKVRARSKWVTVKGFFIWATGFWTMVWFLAANPDIKTLAFGRMNRTLLSLFNITAVVQATGLWTIIEGLPQVIGAEERIQNAIYTIKRQGNALNYMVCAFSVLFAAETLSGQSLILHETAVFFFAFVLFNLVLVGLWEAWGGPDNQLVASLDVSLSDAFVAVGFALVSVPIKATGPHDLPCGYFNQNDVRDNRQIPPFIFLVYGLFSYFMALVTLAKYVMRSPAKSTKEGSVEGAKLVKGATQFVQTPTTQGMRPSLIPSIGSAGSASGSLY